MQIDDYIRRVVGLHMWALENAPYRGPDPVLRKLLPMPTEEWTSDEADPYQLPDDPDSWRDESEE